MRHIHVRVRSGEGAGRVFNLEPPLATIGRDPSCEVSLPHSGISRRHAVLTTEDGHSWYVSDLGSTNGTAMGLERVGQSPMLMPEVGTLTMSGMVLEFWHEHIACDAPCSPGYDVPFEETQNFKTSPLLAGGAPPSVSFSNGVSAGAQATTPTRRITEPLGPQLHRERIEQLELRVQQLEVSNESLEQRTHTLSQERDALLHVKEELGRALEQVKRSNLLLYQEPAALKQRIAALLLELEAAQAAIPPLEAELNRQNARLEPVERERDFLQKDRQTLRTILEATQLQLGTPERDSRLLSLLYKSNAELRARNDQLEKELRQLYEARKADPKPDGEETTAPRRPAPPTSSSVRVTGPAPGEGASGSAKVPAG